MLCSVWFWCFSAWMTWSRLRKAIVAQDRPAAALHGRRGGGEELSRTRPLTTEARLHRIRERARGRAAALRLHVVPEHGVQRVAAAVEGEFVVPVAGERGVAGARGDGRQRLQGDVRTPLT